VDHPERGSLQAPLEPDRQLVVSGPVDRRLNLQRTNEIGVPVHSRQRRGETPHAVLDRIDLDVLESFNPTTWV
jgi:hypothetical protein